MTYFSIELNCLFNDINKDISNYRLVPNLGELEIILKFHDKIAIEIEQDTFALFYREPIINNENKIIYKSKDTKYILELSNLELSYECEEYDKTKESVYINYLKNINILYNRDLVQERLNIINDEIKRILTIKDILKDIIINNKIDDKKKHFTNIDSKIKKNNPNDYSGYCLFGLYNLNTKTSIKLFKNIVKYIVKILQINDIDKEKIELLVCDKKIINDKNNFKDFICKYYYMYNILLHIENYLSYLDICIKVINTNNYYMSNIFCFNNIDKNKIEQLDRKHYTHSYYIRDDNIYAFNKNKNKLTYSDGYFIGLNRDDKCHIYPAQYSVLHNNSNDTSHKEFNYIKLKMMIDYVNDQGDYDIFENIFD